MTSIDHAFAAANMVRNKAIGNRAGDPLVRLLDQIIQRAGPPALIVRAASRPWASALFQGRRHVIQLRIEGIDAAGRSAAFTQGLEAAEWRLTGHFVADITIDDASIDAEGETLDISALTIEEW